MGDYQGYGERPTKKLQEQRDKSDELLRVITRILMKEAGIESSILSLMKSESLLEDFVKLAVADPDRAEWILKGGLDSMVNLRILHGADEELRKRAAGN